MFWFLTVTFSGSFLFELNVMISCIDFLMRFVDVTLLE